MMSDVFKMLKLRLPIPTLAVLLVLKDHDELMYKYQTCLVYFGRQMEGMGMVVLPASVTSDFEVSQRWHSQDRIMMIG